MDQQQSPPWVVAKSRPGDYEFDLCSCCDDPVACCFVYFCTPCAMGSIMDQSGSDFCTGCLVGWCVPCFWPCVGTTQFKKTRQIPIECLNDTCVFFCCGVCELTRQYRESLKFPVIGNFQYQQFYNPPNQPQQAPPQQQQPYAAPPPTGYAQPTQPQSQQIYSQPYAAPPQQQGYAPAPQQGYAPPPAQGYAPQPNPTYPAAQFNQQQQAYNPSQNAVNYAPPPATNPAYAQQGYNPTQPPTYNQVEGS